MMRASDTLADSRVQKPKNFLAFFSRLLPPPLRREAEKGMERKFLVLLRRFSLRKEQSYFNIFVCSFLHPHGDRGAPVSAFSGSSNVREHTQPPSHSPLAFARAGCFGVVCVRLVTSIKFSDDSKESWIVHWHKQICMCLPRPPSARTSPPANASGSLQNVLISPLNNHSGTSTDFARL